MYRAFVLLRRKGLELMTPAAHRACAEDILAIRRELDQIWGTSNLVLTQKINDRLDRLRERLAAETPVTEGIPTPGHESTDIARFVREDIAPHFNSWCDLLKQLAESLPPDGITPDDADRSYVEHEHRAAVRDLSHLIAMAAVTKPRCPSLQDGCDSPDVCRADGECHYTKATLAPRTEKVLTETLITDLWREAGLPEYFLGNGGANHSLVRFVKLAIASAKAEP